MSLNFRYLLVEVLIALGYALQLGHDLHTPSGSLFLWERNLTPLRPLVEIRWTLVPSIRMLVRLIVIPLVVPPSLIRILMVTTPPLGIGGLVLISIIQGCNMFRIGPSAIRCIMICSPTNITGEVGSLDSLYF